MTHSVGRNDPCPCGSGKKYKKCCGAPAAEPKAASHRPTPIILPSDDKAHDFSFAGRQDDEDDREDELDPEEQYEREIDVEVVRYSAMLRGSDSVETILETSRHLADILSLDPEYADVRLRTEDVSTLLGELRKMPNREWTAAENEQFDQIIMRTLSKKDYVAFAEECYSKIRRDFGNSHDPAFKKAFCVGILDLEYWLDHPKAWEDMNLFWHCVAGVSLDGFNAFSGRIKSVIEQYVETVWRCEAWASKRESLGMTRDKACDYIISTPGRFDKVTAEILEAENQVLTAIHDNTVVVDIPDDWVMVTLADVLVTDDPVDGFEDLFSQEGFGGVFAETAEESSVRAAMSSQLAREVCAGLRDAADTFAEDHPLKPMLLLFSRGLPQEMLVDRCSIARECLEAKCRSVIDSPARFMDQRKIVQKMDNDPDAIDLWIDKAVAAGNLTRAAALAGAALTYFAFDPEERLHFARRIREIGKAEPPQARIIPIGS